MNIRDFARCRKESVDDYKIWFNGKENSKEGISFISNNFRSTFNEAIERIYKAIPSTIYNCEGWTEFFPIEGQTPEMYVSFKSGLLESKVYDDATIWAVFEVENADGDACTLWFKFSGTVDEVAWLIS